VQANQGVKPVSRRLEDPDCAYIALDIPCIGCAYDLKTLPLTGRCPECGEAVLNTLAELADWMSTDKLKYLAKETRGFAVSCLVLSFWCLLGSVPLLARSPSFAFGAFFCAFVIVGTALIHLASGVGIMSASKEISNESPPLRMKVALLLGCGALAAAGFYVDLSRVGAPLVTLGVGLVCFVLALPPLVVHQLKAVMRFLRLPTADRPMNQLALFIDTTGFALPLVLAVVIGGAIVAQSRPTPLLQTGWVSQVTSMLPWLMLMWIVAFLAANAAFMIRASRTLSRARARMIQVYRGERRPEAAAQHRAT
jgi:hypothetical protein